MALNDSMLRGKATKPAEKRFELHDGQGLSLEVHPSGKKTWRFRYMRAGKREKVTLGPYPATSLLEARTQRMEAERQLHNGTSPAQLKREQKERGELHTVADVAARWLKEVYEPQNKRAQQDRVYLERDILPRIGRKRPSEVSTQDVRACVDLVLNRGHGQAARRVRSVAKRLLEYAAGHGLVTHNAAHPIRPTHIAPTRSRKRVLRDPEIKAFREAVQQSRLSYLLKAALQFLLLVPARKGEFVQARWVDFDLDAGTWDIVAENSKNGVAIRHRLPRQAMTLLRKLHELTGHTEWVLASNRGLSRNHIAGSTLNGALRTVEGLPEDLVVHDLRRTIRTGLGELGGVPEAVAELCLNHRQGGVAGIYDRSERIDERARALQRWADHLDALAEQSRRVVPLRVRA